MGIILCAVSSGVEDDDALEYYITGITSGGNTFCGNSHAPFAKYTASAGSMTPHTMSPPHYDILYKPPATPFFT